MAIVRFSTRADMENPHRWPGFRYEPETATDSSFRLVDSVLNTGFTVTFFGDFNYQLYGDGNYYLDSLIPGNVTGYEISHDARATWSGPNIHVEYSVTNINIDVHRIQGYTVTNYSGRFLRFILEGSEDTIYGSRYNDYLKGYDENDTLMGDIGNDKLEGGKDNDILDGGSGNDTAVYTGEVSDYTISLNNNEIIVEDTRAFYGNEGIDSLINIENVEFNGISYSFNIDTLNYIASNSDLINAFGLDTEAAYQHYLTNGMKEGRSLEFNTIDYIASYRDLITTFGNDIAAARYHYITNGYAEGRTVSFDALKYLASNADLISAYGSDTDAGSAHYVNSGFAENRTIDGFNAMSYLASNTDLLSTIGNDSQAATLHYLDSGFLNERSTTSFDGYNYIASYSDLIGAFGAHAEAGIQHYVANGFSEGRTASFDAEQYLANYSDLVSAFGTNTQAATIHYITSGFAEGRNDDAQPLPLVKAKADTLDLRDLMMSDSEDELLGALATSETSASDVQQEASYTPSTSTSDTTTTASEAVLSVELAVDTMNIMQSLVEDSVILA